MESLNFKWIHLQFFPSIGVHFTLQDKNQPVYIFFVREASIDATHSLFPYFLSSTKDDNNLQRNSTFSCITNAGTQKKKHGGLHRNREKHQLITCHFQPYQFWFWRTFSFGPCQFLISNIIYKNKKTKQKEKVNQESKLFTAWSFCSFVSEIFLFHFISAPKVNIFKKHFTRHFPTTTEFKY